jgi:protocatechuate 3,4-dioxygenase beta subunit
LNAERTTSFLLGAILVSVLLLIPALALDEGDVGAAQTCKPTRSDSEGPFYVPGAPIRTSTGSGMVVRGRLLGIPDCRPLPGGEIEWWQTNRRGHYDDAHRGRQTVASDGSYRFKTDFPGVYPGRPSHIHFKANAPGYRSLTTQLYLRGGETEVEFDIVLVPER